MYTRACAKINDVHIEPTTSTAGNLIVSNNDPTAASERLQALARENGFTIHDVPGDGNSSLMQFNIS